METGKVALYLLWLGCGLFNDLDSLSSVQTVFSNNPVAHQHFSIPLSTRDVKKPAVLWKRQGGLSKALQAAMPRASIVVSSKDSAKCTAIPAHVNNTLAFFAPPPANPRHWRIRSHEAQNATLRPFGGMGGTLIPPAFCALGKHFALFCNWSLQYIAEGVLLGCNTNGDNNDQPENMARTHGGPEV